MFLGVGGGEEPDRRRWGGKKRAVLDPCSTEGNQPRGDCRQQARWLVDFEMQVKWGSTISQQNNTTARESLEQGRPTIDTVYAPGT